MTPPASGKDPDAIRVGLVTGRPGLGALLVERLAGEPRIDLVAQADGLDASRVAQAPRLDIVLVDGAMPEALDACGSLRARVGTPRPIVVAAPSGDAWAVRAVEAGARGVLGGSPVGKSPDGGGQHPGVLEPLGRAIETVARGEMWLPPEVVSQAVESLLARSRRWAPPGPLGGGRLSPREEEVLALTAGGLSNQEIAGRMRITEATVKAHLTRVFRKLGVRNRAQLAARYHQGRRSET